MFFINAGINIIFFSSPFACVLIVDEKIKNKKEFEKYIIYECNPYLYN